MLNPSRLVLASLAAILLLTGLLNVRSAFGGDPAEPVMDGRAATRLGLTYLQKARDTGDPTYYPKAETLFRMALDENDRDAVAMIGLGTLALARHQFAEALSWGERSRAINAYDPAAYGVIGDAQVELGRYQEATATIQTMVDLRPDLPSLARVSYVRELHGDIPGAIAAMERAAEAGAGIPEDLAWTRAQLGNLHFGQGDLEAARRQYETSLHVLPGYAYGLAGLARVSTARGEWDAAIEDYTRAITTMPIPEFVIALGETYTAAGRLAEAAQQYTLVDVMIQLAGENGVQTDAEFALFLADHGGDPARAVALAETAYAARPSVFAADVLAWSRFRAGDIEGAWTASQEALHLGTRDARMLFHAGMIADARGDRAAAISLLKTALAINPSFSLIATDTARETLNHLTTTTS